MRGFACAGCIALVAGLSVGCGDTGQSTGGSGGSGGSGGAGGTGGSGGMVDAGPPDSPPVPDGPPPPTTLDPDISSMVGQVGVQNLVNSLSSLVGFGTRNSCSAQTGTQGIGAARNWIRDQFAAINGVQVQFDNFDQVGCATTATPEKNVIAWIPGAGHPNRLILIGGHYDSRGSQTQAGAVDGTIPAPGANDSGSQTALVLEAARVMAGHSFDATVVFAAFAGEEQGLYGSKNLALTFHNYFSNGTIEAVLDCDIVGGDVSLNDDAALHEFRLYSPGTPREIFSPADGTTDDTSPARGIMRHIGYWGGGYVPQMTIVPKLREDRPGRGGDHEPFLDAGIAGVRFIETIENFARQHTPDDTIANLTPAYLARVTQVVIASAASLARAPAAPQSIMVGGTASGTVTVSWAAPPTGTPDHYVVAARPVSENFYRTRVAVPGAMVSRQVTAGDLGLGGAAAFFVSVAAVDAAGHESLFAYPEYRCDGSGCVVQPGSLNVTASR